MKILYVNEYLGYFGGVEQNVAFTAQGLTERGHQCYLAYRTATDKEPESYREIFAGAWSTPALGAPHGEPWEKILERTEADVVYLHRVPTVTPFLATPCPKIRMIHDHDLCCPRRHKYYSWNSKVCHQPAGWRCWFDLAFLERDRESKAGFRYVSIPDKLKEMRLNQGLDQLLVASRFMRDELVMNGFAESRVRILAPVVPLKRTPPTDPAEDPHILFVGQLIRGKGVDLLLRSVAKLTCPFSLTIVGGGNFRDKLEALCQQLGLSSSVHFRGWVTHSELEELYLSSRVVAVPSRWAEPFGMIGLEAMSHGRPVVGFAAGGIPDWLSHRENGLLIDELDVEGFSAGLAELLTDRQLAGDLGRRGFEIAHQKFAFERYLDQLEGVFAQS